VFYGSNNRVPNYKHVVPEIFHSSQAELALMCVLLLRGHKLWANCANGRRRMYEFTGSKKLKKTLSY